MRIEFHRLQPPRNPLARLLLGLAGLALLVFFSVFALAIAGVVLAGFLLRRAWLSLQGRAPRTAARPRPADALEGEYTVVHRERTSLSSR